MRFPINIITSNHISAPGIADYLSLILNSLYRASAQLGFDVDIQLNKKLCKKDLTIIIEEFYSKPDFVLKLIAFRRSNPEAKIWCFLSEVPANNTFNEMGASIFHQLIAKLELSLAAKAVLLNELMDKAYGLRALLRLFRLAARFDHHRVYMQVRFNIFSSLKESGVFNKLMVIHSGVKSDDLPLTYFPYIPFDSSRSGVNKSRSFWAVFYGLMTRQRKQQLTKLERLTKRRIYVGKYGDGLRDVMTSNANFSISLTRYSKWAFSSVTRSMHALQFGAIPVFDGNPEVIFDSFEVALGLNNITFASCDSLAVNEFFDKYELESRRRVEIFSEFFESNMQ